MIVVIHGVEVHPGMATGKLVNAAWKRYGTVNSLSLLAVMGGWAGAHHIELDSRARARVSNCRQVSPLIRVVAEYQRALRVLRQRLTRFEAIQIGPMERDADTFFRNRF